MLDLLIVGLMRAQGTLLWMRRLPANAPLVHLPFLAAIHQTAACSSTAFPSKGAQDADVGPRPVPVVDQINASMVSAAALVVVWTIHAVLRDHLVQVDEYV